MTARLPSSILDSAVALDQVSAQWDTDIVRQLTEYIGIPAKSPTFRQAARIHRLAQRPGPVGCDAISVGGGLSKTIIALLDSKRSVFR